MEGKKRKKDSEELKGRICSFFTSLTPSKIAWKKPDKTTLLGPNRSCLNLKTWRSKSVVKATANKTKTKKTTTNTKEKTNKTKSLRLQPNIFFKIISHGNENQIVFSKHKKMPNLRTDSSTPTLLQLITILAIDGWFVPSTNITSNTHKKHFTVFSKFRNKQKKHPKENK